MSVDTVADLFGLDHDERILLRELIAFHDEHERERAEAFARIEARAGAVTEQLSAELSSLLGCRVRVTFGRPSATVGDEVGLAPPVASSLPVPRETDRGSR